MKLALAEITIGYPILRLVSTNNKWEMGIYPTIYGTRVSCGRVNSNFYLKGGYCCGTEGDLLMEVTLLVALILSSQPEDAAIIDLEKALPDWNARPINRDDGLERLRKAAENISSAEILGDEVTKQLANICKNVDLYRRMAHSFMMAGMA